MRAEIPALEPLDHPALVDHLPEFLDGLACWVDGDVGSARSAFGALSHGHAVHRHSLGVDLETVSHEYALLRTAILRVLLAVPTSDLIREPMIRLDEGLDVAIHEGVRRYTYLRDRARDRFVGILAHDLRSPLMTIDLSATAIMDASHDSDPSTHRAALTIARSADRMRRMITDVIEFTRGQLGGSIPLHLSEADLGQIVLDVVDELRIAHPSRTITFHRSGDLRGQWDRDRVSQAVANLISNAVNYGADPIAISVVESTDHRSLTLAVNNKGPPIATEQLASLFDPFRLETPESRKGLGLGLYIVRQVALAHGARCDVRSTAQEGTTFIVVWPRSVPETAPSR